MAVAVLGLADMSVPRGVDGGNTGKVDGMPTAPVLLAEPGPHSASTCMGSHLASFVGRIARSRALHEFRLNAKSVKMGGRNASWTMTADGRGRASSVKAPSTWPARSPKRGKSMVSGGPCSCSCIFQKSSCRPRQLSSPRSGSATEHSPRRVAHACHERAG